MMPLEVLIYEATREIFDDRFPPDVQLSMFDEEAA